MKSLLTDVKASLILTGLLVLSGIMLPAQNEDFFPQDSLKKQNVSRVVIRQESHAQYENSANSSYRLSKEPCQVTTTVCDYDRKGNCTRKAILTMCGEDTTRYSVAINSYDVFGKLAHSNLREESSRRYNAGRESYVFRAVYLQDKFVAGPYAIVKHTWVNGTDTLEKKDSIVFCDGGKICAQYRETEEGYALNKQYRYDEQGRLIFRMEVTELPTRTSGVRITERKTTDIMYEADGSRIETETKMHPSWSVPLTLTTMTKYDASGRMLIRTQAKNGIRSNRDSIACYTTSNGVCYAMYSSAKEACDSMVCEYENGRLKRVKTLLPGRSYSETFYEYAIDGKDSVTYVYNCTTTNTDRHEEYSAKWENNHSSRLVSVIRKDASGAPIEYSYYEEEKQPLTRTFYSYVYQ
jgi:hypothetical protein